MPKYILIALNGATKGEGDEAAYDEWYDDIHIPDLLATPGVQTARRFRILKTKTPRPWTHVALYEIETDDIDATFAHMREHNRPFHAAFDRSQSEAVTAIAMAED